MTYTTGIAPITLFHKNNIPKETSDEKAQADNLEVKISLLRYKILRSYYLEVEKGIDIDMECLQVCIDTLKKHKGSYEIKPSRNKKEELRGINLREVADKMSIKPVYLLSRNTINKKINGDMERIRDMVREYKEIRIKLLRNEVDGETIQTGVKAYQVDTLLIRALADYLEKKIKFFEKNFVPIPPNKRSYYILYLTTGKKRGKEKNYLEERKLKAEEAKAREGK